MENLQNNREKTETLSTQKTKVPLLYLWALWVAFILVRIYSPILGVFGMFLTPSILYLIIRCSGLGSGILATGVAIFLSFVIGGSLVVTDITLLELLPILVFTLLLYANLAPGRVLLGTTIANLLGSIARIFAALIFLRVALTVENMDRYIRDILMSIAPYLSIGETEMLVKYFYGTMGAWLALFYWVWAFVTYQITSYVFRQLLGEGLKPLSPFSYWNIPRWLGLSLVIVLICAYYVNYRSLVLPFWLLNIGVFIFLVSGFLTLIQGLAVSKFFLNRLPMSPLFFGFLVMISFVFPILFLILVAVGVTDLFLDYRKRWIKAS